MKKTPEQKLALRKQKEEEAYRSYFRHIPEEEKTPYMKEVDDILNKAHKELCELSKKYIEDPNQKPDMNSREYKYLGDMIWKLWKLISAPEHMLYTDRIPHE